MRVLVISAAFPPMPSGEATNAYHLCQQLKARGVDVHVLTSSDYRPPVEPGITVHSVMQDWTWSEAPRLRRFLKACAPDVVYLMYLGWTYDFQFMSTFIPTIAKGVLPQTPVVTRFENIGGARCESNSIASRFIRKALATFTRQGQMDYQFGTLLRDSDSIVLLSSLHGPVLESLLPGVGRKCVLIPPPANMCMSEADDAAGERGRQALGIQAGEALLAHIGFIYPGKGIETLLRAFRRLADEKGNVRLAIIGGSVAREFPDQPSYFENLQAMARDLGLERRVIWTGEYRTDEELASTYLRAADICILPFDTGVKLNNSSFSSVAAHGRPIVTTTHAALEPQFVHRENVYLCPPQEPDQLASAIAALVDDAHLRTRLGEGALQLARDWYSWDSAMDKTFRLFGATGAPVSGAVSLSAG